MFLRYILRDLIASFKTDIQEFSFEGPRARLATKTAFACLLSALAAMALDTREIWWAAISALVVSQPYAGASFLKGLQRAVGTVAGAALSIPLVNFLTYFVNTRLAMVAVIFMVTACTLLVSARQRYKYAYQMAGFTSLVVCLATLSDPPMVVEVAYYRCLEILIGIAVAWLVHFLFMPEHATNHLRSAMKGSAEALGRMWSETLDFYLAGKEGLRDISSARREQREALARAGSLVESAYLEGYLGRDSRYLYETLRRVLDEAGTRVAAFQERLIRESGLSYQELYREEIGGIKKRSQAFFKSLEGFLGGEVPSRTVDRSLEELRVAISRAADKYATVRLTGKNLDYPVEDVLHFHFFLGTARDFVEDLSRVAAKEGAGEVSPGPMKSGEVEKHAKGRDGIIDRYILLASLSMTVIPLLWLTLDLPGLTQIAISALIIIQPDHVETERKAVLRFCGCLAGGGAGIFMLGSGLAAYFWTWIIASFLVLFFFSFLANGKPAHAYIGLQGAIAYALTTIQQNGGATSLEPPVIRLTAISLAALVALILTALFAPESPRTRLDSSLNKLARLCRAILDSFGEVLEANNRPESALLSEMEREINKSERMLIIVTQMAEMSLQEKEACDTRLAAIRNLLRDFHTLSGLLTSERAMALPINEKTELLQVFSGIAAASKIDGIMARSQSSSLSSDMEEVRNEILLNLKGFRERARSGVILEMDDLLVLSPAYCLLYGMTWDLEEAFREPAPGMLGPPIIPIGLEPAGQGAQTGQK